MGQRAPCCQPPAHTVRVVFRIQHATSRRGDREGKRRRARGSRRRPTPSVLYSEYNTRRVDAEIGRGWNNGRAAKAHSRGRLRFATGAAARAKRFYLNDSKSVGAGAPVTPRAVRTWRGGTGAHHADTVEDSVKTGQNYGFRVVFRLQHAPSRCCDRETTRRRCMVSADGLRGLCCIRNTTRMTSPRRSVEMGR
jgi:hypothetical protein